MRFVSTLFALLAPSLAFAQSNVATGFEAPGDVALFESIRFVDGKAKIKGGSCEDAVAEAIAEMQAKAQKKKHPVVVAVYDERPKDANFMSHAEVACETKGKNTMVKVEGLAVAPGQDAAFAKVPGERIAEIAGSLTSGGGMVQAQLQAIDLIAYKGGVYYRTTRSREDVWPYGPNRNTRAVTLFREQITPGIEYLSGLVEPVPEIKGVYVIGYAKIMEKGEEVDERFHLYLPTASAVSFAAGDITEQEVIDAGAFLHQKAGGRPVKMDISFIDAED